jgi:outer membrane protein assembly factor BamE (lipoprotein component of BamABCDE complex)
MPNFHAKNIGILGLALILSVALLGCGSKLTQENFDKVQNGMNMEQVKSILGEPTETKSVGVGPFSGISATWKDKKTLINIQFVNDKVALKTFNKST